MLPWDPCFLDLPGSCPQIPPGTCWGHWGQPQPFFTSDCPLTWSLPAPFGLESSLGKGTGAALGLRSNVCYCSAVRKGVCGLMCSNKWDMPSGDVSSREERKVCSKENCFAWEFAIGKYEISPRQPFPGPLAGQRCSSYWDLVPVGRSLLCTLWVWVCVDLSYSFPSPT